MTSSRLTQVAEDLARRADGRVLDYETPPPPRTLGDAAWELIAWLGDSASLAAFCLGVAAMTAGGSVPDRPRLAGLLLTAAAALWMFATVRWACHRPGRW